MIPVEDVGSRHAVPLDAQGEDLALPHQVGIEEKLPLDLLDRLARPPGGNPAQDRDAHGGPEEVFPHELDPARMVALAPDVPLALQELQVVEAVLHRDPEAARDVPGRRGEPVALHELPEEIEDPSLRRCQGGGHVCIVLYIYGEREVAMVCGRGTLLQPQY